MDQKAIEVSLKLPQVHMLDEAHQGGLQVKTIDLRNSSDTAGSKDQVVGYGSFVVY